jgi:hypothetical protein
MIKRVKLILHHYNVKVTTFRGIIINYDFKYRKFYSGRKGKNGDETEYWFNQDEFKNTGIREVLRKQYV